MLLEELYVFLKNREVGERRHHVVEVDAVVPDEDIVGNLRPPLKRLHEVAARGIVGKWHLALGVNVTQHNIDIGQRLYMLGRMHRKQIGECRELLVGETLGKFVEETHIVARQTPLVLVNLAALLTVAIGKIAVVLTHGYHVAVGVGLENRVDACGNNLKQLRIGETPLTRVARTTHTVDI